MLVWRDGGGTNYITEHRCVELGEQIDDMSGLLQDKEGLWLEAR